MDHFRKIDTLTVLIIAVLGLYGGKVTVFYMVYLFWFQELIRTLIDFSYLFWRKKGIVQKLDFIKQSFGSFFILWIYVVFIVLLFGLMLNWGHQQLIADNMMILLFRNWYFNINLLLFFAEYTYFRSKADNTDLQLQIFNSRHIILHISIILGAMIQLAILPRLKVSDNQLVSILTVIPFLLLKFFMDKPKIS